MGGGPPDAENPAAGIEDVDDPARGSVMDSARKSGVRLEEAGPAVGDLGGYLDLVGQAFP
jgi:hypothetical protein